MSIWVIEYDHGKDYSHGVQGVAASLEQALQIVREKAKSVTWEPPSRAIIGGAWIMNGIWNDGFHSGSQFVQYRFTEHTLPADILEPSNKENP